MNRTLGKTYSMAQTAALQAEPPPQRQVDLRTEGQQVAGLRPSPVMRQNRPPPPSVSTRSTAAVELSGKLSLNVELRRLRGFLRRSPRTQGYTFVPSWSKPTNADGLNDSNCHRGRFLLSEAYSSSFALSWSRLGMPKSDKVRDR